MPPESLSDSHSDANVTLDLLSSIANGEGTSQRRLSRRIGVALGLTNALIKRCIAKGWVKVREVPPRRYAYYLTPQGFAEKGRRTAEYVVASLSFFRQAREEYRAIAAEVRSTGVRRVVLYGAGDLCDIAQLAARDEGLDLVGVVEPGANASLLHGLPAYPAPPDADTVILTCSRSPQETFDMLRRDLPPNVTLLAPPLLNISPQPYHVAPEGPPD